MQITVEVPESFVAQAAAIGLSPEVYAQHLLVEDEASRAAINSATENEALRRAEAIDSHSVTLVPWEQIEDRLRTRLAG